MMTTTKCLLVLALTATAACGAPPPTGAALPNQEPAIEFALNYYFAPTPAQHLPVSFVHPDCALTPGGPQVGFLADGLCYTGLTIEGQGIYIALTSARYWQSSLCHELMHSLIGDGGHSSAEAWGAADEQVYGPPGLNGYGGQVAGCMTALSLHPELDAMEIGGAL